MTLLESAHQIKTRSNLPGVVRWYGGKGIMLQKLLPLIPMTPVYVEPYGGAASIMTNLSPRPCEVYNDLDGRLVNLFRVLQNPEQSKLLLDRLRYTPYSFDEFCLALEQRESDDPIEAAWGFYVSQNQGFSGTADTKGNWGRVFVSANGMARNCSAWRSRKASLDAIIRRFERVQIDRCCALECIRYWDSANTTFYLDPPYAEETRAKGERNVYAHEAEDNHHERLVDLILGAKGCVVLSGYDTPLYAPLDASGWRKIEFQTACHAEGRTRKSGLQGNFSAQAKAGRTEVVWLNPKAARLARIDQLSLEFD